MVGHRLAIEQRQGVGEDDAADPRADEFGGAAGDHAAAAGADQDDVMQVLEEQQVGDLGGMRFGVDARAEGVAALGAAVE